ncbi:MAG: hypothetical protein WBL27_01855 [Salinimicrobium sp.]
MEYNVLFIAIDILLFVLLGLWITIGFSLKYRKRKTAQLQKIEGVFAEETSKYLYPLPGEEPDLIEIQRAFRNAGVLRKKPRNVQYMIDLMIRSQRSLLGSNYDKLGLLFQQIPPFRASINKLNSKKWYVKARGIREIYEMDQEQHIKRLIRERNNKNIYVRREAQIAMVIFLGWGSLRFLPYLKREMMLWQQIKIVEKLHDLYPVPELKYLRKAYRAQRPYAQELTMRIIRKFDLDSEVDYILSFLDHENFDRRETAIYCISSFDLNQQRLEQVKDCFFRIPNTEQQVQLLKYIHRISAMTELDFFKQVLLKGNDILKLSTAEILWNGGYKKEVQEFYYQQYAAQPIEDKLEW